MTHAELKNKFLQYHQKTWPERRCFGNPTGWAKYENQYVPYGIPPPLKGKRKKAGGGGADLISLGNEDGYYTAWYFEVKTIIDDLRSNQDSFARGEMTRGAKYYIVKEIKEDEFKIIDYRLC